MQTSSDSAGTGALSCLSSFVRPVGEWPALELRAVRRDGGPFTLVFGEIEQPLFLKSVEHPAQRAEETRVRARPQKLPPAHRAGPAGHPELAPRQERIEELAPRRRLARLRPPDRDQLRVLGVWFHSQVDKKPALAQEQLELNVLRPLAFARRTLLSTQPLEQRRDATDELFQ